MKILKWYWNDLFKFNFFFKLCDITIYEYRNKRNAVKSQVNIKEYIACLFNSLFTAASSESLELELSTSGVVSVMVSK